MPGALGRLEDAAATLNKLGSGEAAAPPARSAATLLWVLRRPLDDD
jgi:hypothetical protein